MLSSLCLSVSQSVSLSLSLSVSVYVCARAVVGFRPNFLGRLDLGVAEVI